MSAINLMFDHVAWSDHHDHLIQAKKLSAKTSHHIQLEVQSGLEMKLVRRSRSVLMQRALCLLKQIYTNSKKPYRLIGELSNYNTVNSLNGWVLIKQCNHISIAITAWQPGC